MANSEVEKTLSKKISTEFWLTIMWITFTVGFSVGVTFMTFQTKAAAQADKTEIMRLMEEKYMPRELSLEKWGNNEDGHKEILNRLAEIQKELREMRKR